MNCSQNWPEPIIRVQSLSESGLRKIPDRFMKPPSDCQCNFTDTTVNVPLIDLENLNSSNDVVRQETIDGIANASREWGFFQVANHGVSHELMEKTRAVWHEFFQLPLEEKQKFANSPVTYEGYGSRIGMEVGAKLDWCDYFYLHYLPQELRDENKWPCLPISCRNLISEYGQELVKLSRRLTKILSLGLGLNEDYIHQSFGGDNETSACLRVNYYPKCPQPELTHGLSPHSDPGGITLLLPDTDIPGLQIRHGNNWLTVNPIPNAFIVNIGDQIQVLSNAIYKSVEHRVIVNSKKERLSLAFFYNPGVMQPANFSDIPELNGENYKIWKERILLHLGCMDIDYAIRKDEPPINEINTQDEIALHEQWERSNHLIVMFINTKISAGIRGSVEQHNNVKALLKAIDEQFETSDKALACTLIMKFSSMRFTSVRGVREHIMKMRDLAAQLKTLEVEMFETFLVHYILNTLPALYGPSRSFITHKDKWSINELMAMCVQEEGQLLMETGESALITTQGKKTNQANKKWKGKAPLETDIKKESKCFFCKRRDT